MFARGVFSSFLLFFIGPFSYISELVLAGCDFIVSVVLFLLGRVYFIHIVGYFSYG